MPRLTNRQKAATFADELARLIRVNDRQVAQGTTTTGSNMLFTVYDGVGINIVITATRDKRECHDRL